MQRKRAVNSERPWKLQEHLLWELFYMAKTGKSSLPTGRLQRSASIWSHTRISGLQENKIPQIVELIESQLERYPLQQTHIWC